MHNLAPKHKNFHDAMKDLNLDLASLMTQQKFPITYLLFLLLLRAYEDAFDDEIKVLTCEI